MEEIRKGVNFMTETYVRIAEPEKIIDWPGNFVISRRKTGNAYMSIRENTLFKIGGSISVNKRLESKACAHCGVSGRIVVKASKENFLRDFIFVDPGKDRW